MKDALAPCPPPGEEPICIQFMAKVGIPAFPPPAPYAEQLLVKCDFCFAPQTDFLIGRQKPWREREQDLWVWLALHLS